MTKSDESEQESEGFSYDPTLNIYQRLARIRSDVQRVSKKGKHAHFTFARHDDVTETLAPLYLKYGVDRGVSVDDVGRDGPVLAVRGTLRWTNVDNPADAKVIGIFAEGVDNGTRKDGSPNIDGLAVGKALSYAVKIAELKNFCLVGESTPDSERATLGPAVAPADTSDLREAYKSCDSEAKLKELRGKVAALMQSGSLTREQALELSPLDHQAKLRLEKK